QGAAAVGEGRTVRVEALVEAVELGILAVGLGVDGGRSGIAFAALGLGLGIGLGQDFLALAVGFRTNAFAVGGAAGPQAVGFLLALGFHAPVDGFGDLGREIDAPQAHVDHIHAQGLGTARHGRLDFLHDGVAVAGDD